MRLTVSGSRPLPASGSTIVPLRRTRSEQLSFELQGSDAIAPAGRVAAAVQGLSSLAHDVASRAMRRAVAGSAMSIRS